MYVFNNFSFTYIIIYNYFKKFNIEYLTNIEFKDRKIYSKILFIDLGGILTSKYEEGYFFKLFFFLKIVIFNKIHQLLILFWLSAIVFVV